jgi:hypothetical protein
MKHIVRVLNSGVEWAIPFLSRAVTNTRTLDAFEYNPFSLTEQPEMAQRISMHRSKSTAGIDLCNLTVWNITDDQNNTLAQ